MLIYTGRFPMLPADLYMMQQGVQKYRNAQSSIGQLFVIPETAANECTAYLRLPAVWALDGDRGACGCSPWLMVHRANRNSFRKSFINANETNGTAPQQHPVHLRVEIPTKSPQIARVLPSASKLCSIKDQLLGLDLELLCRRVVV